MGCRFRYDFRLADQRVVVRSPDRDDQRVAGVGSGQIGRDVQPRILIGRDVLRAVDRHVDAAGQQRALDRGHERSLAPRRVGRPPIAIGLYDDGLRRSTRPDERLGHQAGLHQRERAPSRADADVCAGHCLRLPEAAFGL